MEPLHQHTGPALKTSRDLVLVSGALQDIKDNRMLPPASPGIPPAAFGAGGSMWAASFYRKIHPHSPHFRLKRFDESTVGSRLGSQAATPPLSVKGIGNKGSDISHSSDHFALHLTFRFPVAKPDYSESKIVLAMVTYHHACANFIKSSW